MSSGSTYPTMAEQHGLRSHLRHVGGPGTQPELRYWRQYPARRQHSRVRFYQVDALETGSTGMSTTSRSSGATTVTRPRSSSTAATRSAPPTPVAMTPRRLPAHAGLGDGRRVRDVRHQPVGHVLRRAGGRGHCTTAHTTRAFEDVRWFIMAGSGGATIDVDANGDGDLSDTNDLNDFVLAEGARKSVDGIYRWRDTDRGRRQPGAGQLDDRRRQRHLRVPLGCPGAPAELEQRLLHPGRHRPEPAPLAPTAAPRSGSITRTPPRSPSTRTARAAVPIQRQTAASLSRPTTLPPARRPPTC